MSIINLFNNRPSFSDNDRVREFSEKIELYVSNRRRECRFIRLNDCEVVFGGSEEEPTLVMKAGVENVSGEEVLYASVNDCIMYESDYSDAETFDEAVTDYIAARADRLVKTIIKKEKHRSYKESVYYFSLEAKWELIEEYYTEEPSVCAFKADCTGVEEKIVSYALK